MHSSLQQILIAPHLVSCLPRQNASYLVALHERSPFKRKKYSLYLFPDNSFFPLPFGSTNNLSEDIFSFGAFIGNFFSEHMRAASKLRATFSRAIYDGAARLHNLTIRRQQLSAARGLPVAHFAFSSLLSPYALDDPTRSSRRDPR
jgi:hypothetical protein